jgi:hypothetical protein
LQVPQAEPDGSDPESHPRLGGRRAFGHGQPAIEVADRAALHDASGASAASRRTSQSMPPGEIAPTALPDQRFTPAAPGGRAALITHSGRNSIGAGSPPPRMPTPNAWAGVVPGVVPRHNSAKTSRNLRIGPGYTTTSPRPWGSNHASANSGPVRHFRTSDQLNGSVGAFFVVSALHGMEPLETEVVPYEIWRRGIRSNRGLPPLWLTRVGCVVGSTGGTSVAAHLGVSAGT